MSKRLKKTVAFLVDAIIIALATGAAVVLKYEFNIPQIVGCAEKYFIGLSIIIPSYLLVMIVFNGYRIIWRFAGTRDRTEFSFLVILSNVPYIIAHSLITGGYPVSVYITSIVFMVCALLFVRASYKAIYRIRNRQAGEKLLNSGKKNVMIIGAGSAGNMLLHDLKNSPEMSGYRAACFIDDDKTKIGRSLGGVRVVGDTTTIAENVKKYNTSVIIFAIPSCPNDRRAEILNECSKTGCEVRTLPSLSQMVNGHVSMRNVRNIQVEDLLGREPVKLNLDGVRNFLAGKTVMVTGGGGSIGSELCRQIASFNPSRLIILDIYENNAYDIQNELLRKYPELSLVTLIGSVRDVVRVESVLSEYRPDIIYHAAAHKHVPLMEESPCEAVKNNVFGTLNMVQAADKFGVERLILISTDKAVNPTNVMGATKRICEMIIQSYAKKSKTEFVAVRFGNVLGSNGSVIPLFKKQIEAGGPVTVTHPDITRFFMTIPEAVSLVLEAGIDARGGEIFVLDMGNPVKTLTLAENMIRLSGYTPYKDIKIEFIGLRPGEKLYEEILMKEEGLKSTSNKLIYIASPLEFDEEKFYQKLEELKVSLDERRDIRSIIHEIVPTYKPATNK
ncbi:MAG: polysaccharide biosynthesis protein [Eubacteriales bacterium]|jgi:FlaA1/EpsC-like NDP-sugar epimerase